MIKGRTFVIGDIHGAFKALLQCLARSSFDYKKDTLIVIGDVVDGWPEVPQCISKLLTVKNLIYVWGNHDWWVNKWFKTGWTHPIWEEQGGNATKEAYVKQGDLLVAHRDFFDRAVKYYIIGKKLFVHGGLYPINKPIEKQELNDLMWDRDLFNAARFKHFKKPDYKYAGYDDIFIGHTTTEGVHDGEPVHVCNIWNIDQGAGWSGKLTIMDINTKEYWQSDNVLKLYTNVKGRF